MFVKVELSDGEIKYLFTKRYCFHCKRVAEFMRCENCGKFACKECQYEIEPPEYGDYGSILAPAYLAHIKCIQ